MKNNLKFKNILVLIISITFFSCETNVEEEPDTIAEELCDSAISFTASIKSIFDNNCIECHGGNRFPDLRTHQGISNSAEIVKAQVVNRTMPQGGSLTNDQIELIRCWIDNGALNN